MSLRHYQSQLVQESWTLPTDLSQPHRKIECGAWVRETVDRPSSVSSNVTTAQQQPYYDEYRLSEEGQFRVLLLHSSGNVDDEIRADLALAALHDGTASVKFDALSYVWGDQRDKFAMILNGQQYHIGLNLDRALRSLRLHSKTRYIWVDILCINQEDIDEKLHQVLIMRDIYAAAENVVGFIGHEHNVGAEHAMTFLGHCLDDGGLGSLQPWRYLPVGDTDGSHGLASGLNAVMACEWFKRSWTTQEGAVAKSLTLQHGTHSLSWCNTPATVFAFMQALKLAVVSPQWRHTVVRAGRGQHTLSDINIEPMLGLLSMQLDSGPYRKAWQQYRKTPDLLDVVYSTRNRKCSDERDKIFSVLGLVEQGPMAMAADYHLTVEESYARFDKNMRQITKKTCDELSALTRRTIDSAPHSVLQDAVPPRRSSRSASASLVDIALSTKQVCAELIPQLSLTLAPRDETGRLHINRARSSPAECDAKPTGQGPDVATELSSVAMPRDPTKEIHSSETAQDTVANVATSTMLADHARLNQDVETMAIIRHAYFQAVLSVRNNDTMRAARALEETAMILRGRSLR